MSMAEVGVERLAGFFEVVASCVGVARSVEPSSLLPQNFWPLMPWRVCHLWACIHCTPIDLISILDHLDS